MLQVFLTLLVGLAALFNSDFSFGQPLENVKVVDALLRSSMWPTTTSATWVCM
jgi:hypothetical protein